MINNKLYFVLFISLLFVVKLNAQRGNDILPDSTIYFGYSTKTLIDFDATNAKAALEVLSTHIARQRGYSNKIETIFYSDLDELEKDLSENKLHMIVFIPHDYIKMKDKYQIEPALVSERNGSAFTKFVLICRKDNIKRDFNYFKNKKLFVSVSEGNDLPFLWLNNILYDNGIESYKSLFGQVSEVAKPASAVLPVFFSKADAAIVLKSSYDLLKELNSQIKNDLIVLAESEPILLSITAFNSNLSYSKKKNLQESIVSIKNSKEGKQMLDLFKVDSMVAYNPNYLKSTEDLLNKNKRIKKNN